MKNYIRMFLLLLLISICTACASTPADSSAKEQGNGVVHKEKKQNQKKLLFEDWKYKGFGQSLPVWFEAAYKENPAEIQKLVNELKEHKIMIISAFGINSDQADKALKLKISELSEDYKLYDSCWALLGEKAAVEGKKTYPYYAAAVLFID